MGSASTHGIARKAPLPLPFVPSPPIAPEGLSADLTAMVQRMIAAGPASDAEALRALRGAFPDAPLTLRVAALDTMMRRHAG